MLERKLIVVLFKPSYNSLRHFRWWSKFVFFAGKQKDRNRNVFNRNSKWLYVLIIWSPTIYRSW